MKYISIFPEILRFFKVKATFPYSGKGFFTNPSSGWWERIFCLVETVFLIRAIFLLVEAMVEIKGKTVFK